LKKFKKKQIIKGLADYLNERHVAMFVFPRDLKLTSIEVHERLNHNFRDVM
jgi:hypothetical protein